MSDDDLSDAQKDALVRELQERVLNPPPAPEPEPESRPRRRMNPGHAMIGAARIRTEAHGPDPFADRCEAEARAPLPEVQTRHGAGTELVPMEQFAEDACPIVIDTLEKPDYVAADASRERLELLEQAGVLTSGLDTADSIQARDSMERMMSHQLAMLHASTMKLAVQLNRGIERMDAHSANPAARATANVEACRLAGALSRLSTTYQSGLAAMQRLRSGGKQTYIFQHNHVGNGGQAVIGGNVSGGRGSRKPGRGRKQSG